MFAFLTVARVPDKRFSRREWTINRSVHFFLVAFQCPVRYRRQQDTPHQNHRPPATRFSRGYMMHNIFRWQCWRVRQTVVVISWILFGPFLKHISIFVQAKLHNLTIDDQYGDEHSKQLPLYVPTSGWVQGVNCTDCHASPNVSLVHDKTWHEPFGYDDASSRTVSITFNGTSVSN